MGNYTAANVVLATVMVSLITFCVPQDVAAMGTDDILDKQGFNVRIEEVGIDYMRAVVVRSGWSWKYGELIWLEGSCSRVVSEGSLASVRYKNAFSAWLISRGRKCTIHYAAQQ